MCSKPVTSSLWQTLMSQLDVCLPPHGLHVLASCTHCKIALAETNIRLHRHTQTVYQTIAAAFHITHRSRAVPLKHQPAQLAPDTAQLLCPLLSRAQASLKTWSDRLVVSSQAISDWFTTTAMAGNNTSKCPRALTEPYTILQRGSTAASPACLHCRERNE